VAFALLLLLPQERIFWQLCFSANFSRIYRSGGMAAAKVSLVICRVEWDEMSTHHEIPQCKIRQIRQIHTFKICKM
jgi:hypothetical protein